MRSFRLFLLVLSTVASASWAADRQPLSPELAGTLVQARSVYLVTGHVRYYSYRGKHFIKPELVDTTPFEEPCHKEFEKWGRFTIVPNVADADLVVRVYMTGDTSSVPVVSPGVTGSVVVGATFVNLEVVQRSSGKILWSGSKNEARSWSTKTAVGGLVKQFREFLEQQEKSSQGTSLASAGATN